MSACLGLGQGDTGRARGTFTTERVVPHLATFLLPRLHGEGNVRASGSPLAVVKVGENPVSPGRGGRSEGGVQTPRHNEASRMRRRLRLTVAALPPVGTLRADFPAHDQGVAVRVGGVEPRRE